MEAYKCDVMRIAEMRWTGMGEINNGEVIWSGEERQHINQSINIRLFDVKVISQLSKPN